MESKIKTIHITLPLEEYERIKKIKGKLSWAEFLLKLTEAYMKGETGLQSEEAQETTKQLTDYLASLEEAIYEHEKKLSEIDRIKEAISQFEERLRTLESVVSSKISEKYSEEGKTSTPFTTAEKVMERQSEGQRVRRGELPATEKQIKYMRSLMMETKLPVNMVEEATGVDVTSNNITREEASRVIDYLLEKRKELGTASQKKSRPRSGKRREEGMVPASRSQVEEIRRLVMKASKMWNIKPDDVIVQATGMTGISSITSVEDLSLNLLTESDAEKLIKWLKERVG